jgi:hypothetical protein
MAPGSDLVSAAGVCVDVSDFAVVRPVTAVPTSASAPTVIASRLE